MQNSINNSLDEFGITSSPITNKKRGLTPEDLGYDELTKDSKQKAHSVYKQWSVIDNKYFGCGESIPTLNPGAYHVRSSESGIYFECMNINIDDLILFPNSISTQIMEEIETFWMRKIYFDQHGFLHRRGYLMYGPPGSGKTSIVHFIIKDIVERSGLVLYCSCSPGLVDEGLTLLRKIEPDRQIVCVYEDIDAIVQRYGEPELLATLDGENQISNVLNVATTNYPERLDRRIVSRPRRFDRLIRIGMPGAIERSMYFTSKLKLDKTEVSPWVKDTEGFSFAALAELVISVKCLGNNYKESVQKLQALMTEKVPSSDYFEGKVGF